MKPERREFKRKWLAQIKGRSLFCVICGELIQKASELTVEHEPPKSRQKDLGKSLIYPSHKKCNNDKGALTLDEYKEYIRLNNIRVGKSK